MNCKRINCKIFGQLRSAAIALCCAGLLGTAHAEPADNYYNALSSEASGSVAVQNTAGQDRYQLGRDESLLMMNIELADSFFDKANYLYLENVFTGQTYRVKMRSGTHLLKVQAGVYRADMERLNQRLFASKADRGAGLNAPAKTELTLMPQTVNFAGTWAFSNDSRYGDLRISGDKNPATAIAKRYPVISQYPLHKTLGNSTRMVAVDWPMESREMVSFSN